jgi:hypothetical protein
VVDRRFWVADGRRAEFENVFRTDGIWARFLRQAEGYVATEVSCESSEDGRYRVRDFWSWHRKFEIFRERYSEDFASFDRDIVQDLIVKQEFVGAYYEAGETNSGTA